MSFDMSEDRIAATKNLHFLAKNAHGVLGAGPSDTVILRSVSDTTPFIAITDLPIQAGSGYVEAVIQSVPEDQSHVKLMLGFINSAEPGDMEPGLDVNSAAFHLHHSRMMSKGTAYNTYTHLCLPIRAGMVIGLGMTLSGPLARNRVYYVTVNGRALHSGPLRFEAATSTSQPNSPHLTLAMAGIGLGVALRTRGPFAYDGDREGRRVGPTPDDAELEALMPVGGSVHDSEVHEAASAVATNAAISGRQQAVSARTSMMSAVMAPPNPHAQAMAEIRRLRSPTSNSESHTHHRPGSAAQSAVAATSSPRPLASPIGGAGAIGSYGVNPMEAALQAVARVHADLKAELDLLKQEKDMYAKRCREAEERVASVKIDDFEQMRSKLDICEGKERAIGAASDSMLDVIATELSTALLAIQEERSRRERCIVCMDARKTVLFLPCKHYAVCKKCCSSLSICPICRASISEKVNLS